MMKAPVYLFVLFVVLPLILLIFILGLGVSKAQSMTASHQQGQAVAQGLLGGPQTAAKSADLQNIPHFKTASPSETDMTPSSVESRSGTSLRSNEAGQFLLESHHKRPTFKIDADRDPLMSQAKEAVQNPLRTLEVTVKAEGKDGEAVSTPVVCEEEGDPYPESCLIRIIPEIRQKYERVFLYQHHWGWGRHPYNPSYINFFDVNHPYSHSVDYQSYSWQEGVNGHFHHHQNHYKYQKRFEATNTDGSFSVSDPTEMSPQEYQEVLDKTKAAEGKAAQVPPSEIVQAESEQNACFVLEDLVERGVCQYGEKICVEPNQTRVIQGVPITRECWAYRQTYGCIEPLPTNTCEALRAKGCVQVSSTCKTKKYGVCLVYRQTYSCPGGKSGLKKLSTQGGNSPFCLTGNCADSSYDANGEMFEAMSHLAVLKEAQDDIRKNIGIFKGDDRRCTRNCVNFRDCCGVGKGWGVSLGFGCSANEKDLAMKRGQNKCVQIGTCCAKKLLGQCLEKKTTFCCFGTKLARLIQEAGHQQLGLSWGSPENPQCQGLSPDQLSHMDFSRIDFSELFQDIADKFKPKGQAELTHSISADRLKDNMTRLTDPKAKGMGQSSHSQKGTVK